MNKGIKVARLFGITIRVDWSWLLILLLVSWNLTITFTQVHPTWSATFAVLIGVGAALLFFLSVLLHELAHSLVAQAQGIPVDSITLFLFGGVSNIREEPKSPGNEFWMAILGPLTSLAIGFGLLLIAGSGLQLDSLQNGQLTTLLSDLSAFQTLALWLGSTNVLLGFFNLIPGYPLDGGRVLRSIIWAITKDLQKATRWASAVGQGIAWLMILAGMAMMFGYTVPFFGRGLLNGVWIILIGWFLNNASTRSYQQLLLRTVLEDVPVRRMTRQNPPTVEAGISVNDLVEHHIMQTDDHAFPVMQNGALVGIVCLDDVRAVPAGERDNRTVAEIMTPRAELITIGPDEPAQEALMAISQHAVRQLVVLENDVLFGLIRRRDIVRYLQLHAEPAAGEPSMRGDLG
ncbi:MAG: site-2 protease family protein [Chloroflexota bacterium]|nr:site-2 protease family protein [Chloroflexota bacterium]